MRTGLIGGGKMAEALLSGMLAQKVCKAEELLVSDLDPGRRQWLHERYGIETLEQNLAVAERSDVVILAVKPQHLDPVLTELAPVAAGRLFVSIAAGRRLATFEQRLSGARMVRVMPNLPFQAGEGMSVCCRGTAATEADIELVRQMLESGGRVLELDESFFDVVTALSGSGPAFLAFVVQAFVQTAVLHGMATETALELALQTMRGTATIMMQDGIAPADLMTSVASKGGTTAAGLAVLDNSDVRAVLQATLDAAAQRSAELSA